MVARGAWRITGRCSRPQLQIWAYSQPLPWGSRDMEHRLKKWGGGRTNGGKKTSSRRRSRRTHFYAVIKAQTREPNRHPQAITETEATVVGRNSLNEIEGNCSFRRTNPCRRGVPLGTRSTVAPTGWVHSGRMKKGGNTMGRSKNV